MTRWLFGIFLAIVGLLYLWLAIQAVSPGIQDSDWVSYLGAFLFLLAAIGAVIASVNLLRPKRNR